MVSKVLFKVLDRIFGKRFFKYRKRSQNNFLKTLKTQKRSKKCKNCTKLQERIEYAKLPKRRKSRLNRDLNREYTKPAVKFTASRLRGLGNLQSTLHKSQ